MGYQVEHLGLQRTISMQALTVEHCLFPSSKSYENNSSRKIIKRSIQETSQINNQKLSCLRFYILKELCAAAEWMWCYKRESVFIYVEKINFYNIL